MEGIIVLIIYLISGFIGRSVGKKRTIGAAAGFAIGFCLGIIGLIIVLCCKKVEPVNESAQTSNAPLDNNNPSSEAVGHGTPPTDESLLDNHATIGDSYLDQLVGEVCLHGDDLMKYERFVTKKYGSETYVALQRFVEEVSHSAQRHKFTNTSIANISYLGHNLGLSDSTVNNIVIHYQMLQ